MLLRMKRASVLCLVYGALILISDGSQAQYTYGTNSEGGSCIANGVDCFTGYQGGNSGGRAAPRRYAAFAVMEDEGTAFAFSYDFDTQAAAEQDALARCSAKANGQPCQIAGWFYNTCGALAQDDGKTWGFAYGGSLKSAERKAMKNCDKFDNKIGVCKISKSFCQ